MSSSKDGIENKIWRMGDLPSVAPWDSHNQRWVKHVHPPDWSNPEPKEKYDLLVIGAGPAGLVAAIGAAGLGARVALVEKHLLGGDCLNVGCVPSKAVLRAGRAFSSVREISHFGIEIEGRIEVRFDRVMERVRRIRADISHHDSAHRLSGLGIDVFIGSGQFGSPDRFEIDGKTIRFKKACVATGARAAAPPIEGLDQVEYLTNETVFTLTELPERLGIIGAGPIGCELGQAFVRFGSAVHLIETAHGILPRDDREAASIVESSLKRDGVKLLCCGKNLKVAQGENGIRLWVKSHEIPYNLEVDRLIVAVGRAPNVEGLGLEAAGVEFTNKGIRVDDRLRTTNKRIFAAGDVASKYQFTHAADFLARNVIRNALFFGRAKASSLVIPWCTYTEPELAHIGKTSDELEKEGVSYQTFTVSLNDVDRALLDGEENGFVRVHADKRGRILGATIVASHAGDMMGAVSVAMTNGVSLARIASSIHPYPTQMEAFRKVGDAYNKTRLTPFGKRILGFLLALHR